jgi:hypothetical protein
VGEVIAICIFIDDSESGKTICDDLFGGSVEDCNLISESVELYESITKKDEGISYYATQLFSYGKSILVLNVVFSLVVFVIIWISVIIVCFIYRNYSDY